MSDTVIDACCLVNLCAAGDLGRMIEHTGLKWHVPTIVINETLYTYRFDEDGGLARQKID